jgi:hypothetical protein
MQAASNFAIFITGHLFICRMSQLSMSSPAGCDKPGSFGPHAALGLGHQCTDLLAGVPPALAELLCQGSVPVFVVNFPAAAWLGRLGGPAGPVREAG